MTLGFDLYLENPYGFLLTYAKVFKIEKEIMRDIVQFAWTFLNDCAGTTLCLQYEPEVSLIVWCCMDVSCHILKRVDTLNVNANINLISFRLLRYQSWNCL